MQPFLGLHPLEAPMGNLSIATSSLYLFREVVGDRLDIFDVGAAVGTGVGPVVSSHLWRSSGDMAEAACVK